MNVLSTFATHAKILRSKKMKATHFKRSITPVNHVGRGELGGGGNSTKMENFGIDLCPLQGSFFSQFGAENSKRHGVYLQKKGPPSAIYNFNLYGQNARFGGFSTFS